MTNEERIKQLEEQIFAIKVGSDFLSYEDWEIIHKCEKEIEELQNAG